MIFNKKICVIIPIKHSSQRVPGKNYRMFNNYPLYQYIVDTLLSCSFIDQIVIDTNSPIIKEGINHKYKEQNIIIYDRPENLCSHDTPVNNLLINVIESLKLNTQFDIFIQTHTTNPLLRKETILESLQKYIDGLNQGYDSLFTVKKWQTRLYTQKNNIVEALNHNINELIPTQDLNPLYEENSCLYIFNYENLFKRKHRIGYNPLIIVMDDLESQDIDTETDFKLAELIGKSYTEKNNIVLITGVFGGIGRDIANKFKLNNWIVIGTDLHQDDKSEMCDLFIQEDISTVEGCFRISRLIKEKYSHLNCLINNAAYQQCKKLIEFEADEWDLTHNTNVRSCFLLSKYLYDLLKNSSGSIINISSVHSIATSKNIACYASSKGSLSSLTRAMSLEFAEDKIRVNSICPGAINTTMLMDGLRRNKDKTVEENRKSLESKHPCNFIGSPNDISEMCLFLSDNNKSRYIYGQNIVIDGGATIRLSTE